MTRTRAGTLPEVELELLDLEVVPDWAGRRRPHNPLDLLSVSGLDVRYGRRVVVTDVHVRVRPGEVVALIGHNGCGKSSTLRAIFGIGGRERGEVMVGGVPLGAERTAAADAGMGFVPATRPVFDDLTVRENLVLGGHRERDPGAVAERIAAALDLFPELVDRLDIAAAKLSGGEQRMVGIAIALMAAPRILLLDEPTQGLSPSAAVRVVEAARALAVEQATAVLIAEVNVAAAIRVADRVYVMDTGSIRSEHRGAELRAVGPSGWWDLF